jgi:hypothetical protein
MSGYSTLSGRRCDRLAPVRNRLPTFKVRRDRPGRLKSLSIMVEPVLEQIVDNSYAGENFSGFVHLLETLTSRSACPKISAPSTFARRTRKSANRLHRSYTVGGHGVGRTADPVYRQRSGPAK